MGGSSIHGLRWFTLALLLPLLVLGVLAWFGTRAQVRAAWSSAREEAKSAAVIAEELLARELAAAVETAPLFPDPPEPGTASAADAVLDGSDPPALRTLRDDPAAGRSPAGLPRRVLAGLRLYGLTKEAADGEALLKLATQDAPSVLTPLAFTKLGPLAGDWPQRWARGNQARAVFHRHPDLNAHGKWISEGGETMWLAADEGKLRMIDPPAFQQALGQAGRGLPAWAGIQLSLDGWKAAGLLTDFEVMVSIPVKFGGDLVLEIVAARPALIEAAARQQAQWTVGLLLLAFATSVSALVFIHRAVERERRFNAMKSDFVASVSHELRAPVASIRLMADALNAEKIEPQTVREFHRLISREGARLSTLIENVLDFARIEQGRKQWHFEPGELGPLLADTLCLMAPLAAEKGITLVSPKSFPTVEANIDPGAIQQALVNLLDNAIKFSPAGSRIDVSLRKDETSSYWEVNIADQGPGIPHAEKQAIFRKFYRLGSELRRETQGTGIGLSLVKAVAEVHGGDVRVASAVGEGSVFTLTGPIRSNS